MTTLNRILAVGAAGKFAGLVVPELVKRGAIVRGLVRNPEKAEEARANGVTEIAIGDLSDRAAIESALQGVDGVFYLAPAFLQDEAQVGMQLVEAAKAAGVRRFLFSGAIHPVISQLANHNGKPAVEEALIRSGMQYTLLQPGVFYQNMAPALPVAAEHGVFAEPFSSTSTLGRVDYRDVAEVAALALTGDALAYGTFELTAGENTDRDHVVRIMGEVLGREVKSVTPTFEQWAAMVHLPDAARPTQMLRAMYAYYDRHGLQGNSLTLRAILGREPRSLKAYFTELAQDQSLANSR
ncbi:NmrA family NAD(P)-binding protein [Undibacterium sp. Tian12W]|uniref:NmrA family NAD(P)-binding protein n=1 Tax=Undibacterium sp. Tian12W TaxID=3413054 RepID=UPI003BF0E32A